MDGPRHIFARREDRTRDHLPQLALRHGNALFRLHVGKLGIVLGVHRRDRKGGNAAADKDAEFFIDCDGHLVVGQLPDDVKKQTRRHDARAGLGNVGGNADGDPRFQIITRQHDFHTRLNEQALQRRDRALWRDGPRGHGDGGNKQRFFTGKLHRDDLFSLKIDPFFREKGSKVSNSKQ